MGRDGGHAQSNHKPGYMGKKDSGDKKHGEGNKGGHRDRKVNPHSAKGKPFVERLGGYASANKAREESQFDPHTNKPRKLEINFDPEKRNEYLTGFSKRTKVRRQFGLAMQALKDRNERVAERKERREEKEKDQVLWDEVEMLDGKKVSQTYACLLVSLIGCLKHIIPPPPLCACSHVFVCAGPTVRRGGAREGDCCVRGRADEGNVRWRGVRQHQLRHARRL